MLSPHMLESPDIKDLMSIVKGYHFVSAGTLCLSQFDAADLPHKNPSLTRRAKHEYSGGNPGRSVSAVTFHARIAV